MLFDERQQYFSICSSVDVQKSLARKPQIRTSTLRPRWYTEQERETERENQIYRRVQKKKKIKKSREQ